MSQDRKPGEQELRSRLTPLQYHVTQEKGTERPFTGQYAAHNDVGTYYCVVCGSGPVRVGKEIRRRVRLAELLAAAGWRPRPPASRYFARHDPHRSHLRPAAMPTWGMCSTTVPSPRACATASTPLRWASAEGLGGARRAGCRTGGAGRYGRRAGSGGGRPG